MSALPSYRRVIVGLVALTELSLCVVGVANTVTQAQRASVDAQRAAVLPPIPVLPIGAKVPVASAGAA